jgi:hypothetical protein
MDSLTRRDEYKSVVSGAPGGAFFTSPGVVPLLSRFGPRT